MQMGTKNFILKFVNIFKKSIIYAFIFKKKIIKSKFFNFVWYSDKKIIRKRYNIKILLKNINNLCFFLKKNFLLRIVFKNFCTLTLKCIYSIIPLDKYYLLFLDILYHI